MSKPILTQEEIQDYVTAVLIAFRQDLERDFTDDDGACVDDLRAWLYDLTGYFELDPVRQALVCGSQTCTLLDPPAEPLVIVSHNGVGPQIRKVADLSPDEREQLEANWKRLVASCQPTGRSVAELIEAGEWGQ